MVNVSVCLAMEIGRPESSFYNSTSNGTRPSSRVVTHILVAIYAMRMMVFIENLLIVQYLAKFPMEPLNPFPSGLQPSDSSAEDA